jgi:hypothetical protein
MGESVRILDRLNEIGMGRHCNPFRLSLKLWFKIATAASALIIDFSALSINFQ